MFRLVTILALLLFSFAGVAHAEPNTTRVDTVLMYHATAPTSTALLIPVVDVGSQLQGWRVCADNGNTGSVLVGVALNSSDAAVLGPNSCFSCTDISGSTCSNSGLKSLQVKGSAASQGYSVAQFR